MGADPQQLPLEAGYLNLPCLPVRLKIWSSLRETSGKGVVMLLYQGSSLHKPVPTATPTQLQFQLDLYLSTALHNPQRHQVAK